MYKDAHVNKDYFMKWGTTWENGRGAGVYQGSLMLLFFFRIDSRQTGIETHLWLAREQLPSLETGNRKRSTENL